MVSPTVAEVLSALLAIVKSGDDVVATLTSLEVLSTVPLHGSLAEAAAVLVIVLQLSTSDWVTV